MQHSVKGGHSILHVLCVCVLHSIPFCLSCLLPFFLGCFHFILSHQLLTELPVVALWPQVSPISQGLCLLISEIRVG